MELIYKEESKKIIGPAFRVYNTIGFGFQEKEYKKAMCAELDLLKLRYKIEVYSDLVYLGQKLRGYFIDLLVEDKIAVELKVANNIYQRHFFQLFQYLKNNNLKLGLIIVFSPSEVLVKRVVNLK